MLGLSFWDYIMDYESALIAARNGNAVLFYGAGFTYKLLSYTNKNIPNGESLAEILCDEIDKSGFTKDLKLAANLFLKTKDAPSLIQILQKYFKLSSVPQTYNPITSNNWKAIYTTNYDNSFEISALAQNINYHSIDLDQKPKDFSDNKRVIHINGYIDSLTEEKLNTSFKLTNSSYLTEQFRTTVWSEIFKRDLRAAQAIFFVGYSLYDIDIQEILIAEEIKDKTFFIDKPVSDLDQISYSIMSDFGQILNIGTVGFAKDLAEVDPLAINQIQELIITSFQRIYFKDTVKSLDDEIIWDLFLKGDIESNLFFKDYLSSNQEYLIKREDFNEYISLIDNPNTDNLIIYGELANGKSVLAKQIAAYFFTKDYPIYELNDDYVQDITLREIENIIKKHQKGLFIIENYTEHFEIISHINQNNLNSNFKMLLTSRTFEHDKSESDVYYNHRILEIAKTKEVNIDFLTDEEISKIIDLLDKYGLWGDFYSKNDTQKRAILKDNKNYQFHSILLKIFKSPQVEIRISEFYQEMLKSEIVMKNIVAILTLSVSNISKPTFHMVAAITNSNAIFEPHLRKTKIFRQLISTHNDTFIPKSSMLAAFILSQFPQPSYLINTLVEIAKNARQKSNNKDVYFSFYKDLASFRRIQHILPTKNSKRENLVQFYEGLKNHVHVERQNPHFWLQYAIARLSFPENSENLTLAKNHLDTALSLGLARNNYWTDDIETQLARYYLLNANHSYKLDDVDKAFKDFQNALIILKQILRANRRIKRELFRPLALIDNFYFKFKINFDDSQRLQIVNNIQEIKSLLTKNEYNFSDEKNFQRANESITKVTTDINLVNHMAKNNN